MSFTTLAADAMDHRENYKLIVGSIVPRPIAFVSTRSSDGSLNLAPFSYFNGVSSKPPTVSISIMQKFSDSGTKDTLRNILDTGEFVVNIVTEDIVEAMNETATEFPADVNEFEISGLTPISSELVSPPRVKESPIQMECTLFHHVQVGDGSPGSATLVIGEVKLFHVRQDLLYNGKIDIRKLKPVGRLAGGEYTRLGELFTIERKPYQGK
ncbi:MAG: flavin reductase family protein [Calditrichia bacterium]